MRGRKIIFVAALALCASATQVTFLQNTGRAQNPPARPSTSKLPDVVVQLPDLLIDAVRPTSDNKSVHIHVVNRGVVDAPESHVLLQVFTSGASPAKEAIETVPPIKTKTDTWIVVGAESWLSILKDATSLTAVANYNHSFKEVTEKNNSLHVSLVVDPASSVGTNPSFGEGVPHFPGPCEIAFLNSTKVFVSEGKIFANVYMKRVGDDVCKNEYRPLVYVRFFTPDLKPLPPFMPKAQELGRGSSPDKWGTIVNSIEATCQGLCQQYCTDPNAANPCRAEISLESSSTPPPQESYGWHLGVSIDFSHFYGADEASLCKVYGKNSRYVVLSFYKTLGDYHKDATKANPSSAFCADRTIKLPLQ